MDQVSESRYLPSTVGYFAKLLSEGLAPGDIAALRRLRPGAPDCSAFWRVMALQESVLPGRGPHRDEAERRWACILQAMAVLKGMHQPSAAMGPALAEANISEHRVLRLLRASGDPLADAVRITAHHLSQKAVAIDQADLAALVLSDGEPTQEAVRRRIARRYYNTLSKEALK